MVSLEEEVEDFLRSIKIVVLVPVVVGVIKRLYKICEKHLEVIDIATWLKFLQKIAMLGTIRILANVFEK